MGRIGKRELSIPAGVEVKVTDEQVEVKGPKGLLTQAYRPVVKIVAKDQKLTTEVFSQDPKVFALQGLYNSLLKNMIDGVTNGFEKKLEMVGVGYRVAKEGKRLQISIGYSHPVVFDPPEGIEFVTEGATKITVKGADKQLVGQLAAEIRMTREVEPYKGKGFRYVGEKVRKKAGKAAKAAGGAA